MDELKWQAHRIKEGTASHEERKAVADILASQPLIERVKFALNDIAGIEADIRFYYATEKGEWFYCFGIRAEQMPDFVLKLQNAFGAYNGIDPFSMSRLYALRYTRSENQKFGFVNGLTYAEPIYDGYDGVDHPATVHVRYDFSPI